MFVFGQAQEEAKKYSLGVHVSLDANYRTLSLNYDKLSLGTTESVISLRNEMETMMFGFGSGMNLCMNLNSSLNLIFSPKYALKGYQIRDMNLSYVNDNNDGFTSAGTTNIQYRYHFIDLPLLLAYNFKVKNINLFVSTGVEGNIFLSTFVHTTNYTENGKKNKSKEEEVDDNRKVITPSILASTGITWDLNTTQKFRIEPMFRYQLVKLNQTPITEQLWNVGLNISYYFL